MIWTFKHTFCTLESLKLEGSYVRDLVFISCAKFMKERTQFYEDDTTTPGARTPVTVGKASGVGKTRTNPYKK